MYGMNYKTIILEQLMAKAYEEIAKMVAREGGAPKDGDICGVVRTGVQATGPLLGSGPANSRSLNVPVRRI